MFQKNKFPFCSRPKPKTVRSAIGLLVTYVLSLLTYLASAIVLKYVGDVTVVLLVLNFFDIVDYGWFIICLGGFISAFVVFIVNFICKLILETLNK